MDREKLKEALKNLADPTLNPEDDMVDGFKLRYFLKEIIDALLEDDKPKTEEERLKEIEETTRKVFIARDKGIAAALCGYIPEELQAIKESIIHWRNNVSRLKLADELGFSIKTDVCTWYIVKDFSRGIIGYCDVDHCSLCRLSYSSSSSFCHNCPLAIKNVRCQTTDSPWYRCKNAKGNQEIIEAAENMVRVLESLLE